MMAAGELADPGLAGATGPGWGSIAGRLPIAASAPEIIAAGEFGEGCAAGRANNAGTPALAGREGGAGAGFLENGLSAIRACRSASVRRTKVEPPGEALLDRNPVGL
jgi:hypothetical protein